MELSCGEAQTNSCSKGEEGHFLAISGQLIFGQFFLQILLSNFDVHVLANIGSCNFAMELSCSVTQTKSCRMKTKKTLKL